MNYRSPTNWPTHRGKARRQNRARVIRRPITTNTNQDKEHRP